MTASAPIEGAAARRWLPSLPRRRDWCYAGTFLGAVLGASELLLLWLRGESPSMAMALAVLLGAAVGLAVLCLGAGFLWSRLRSPTRSELVGATLGPLLLFVAAGAGIEAARQSALAGLLYATATFAAAGLASFLGARAGVQLERAALPPPGPWVWTLCAAFVALSEHAAVSDRRFATIATGIALLLALSLAGLEWMKHNTRPSRSWARSARLALAAGCGIALGPSLLPWAFSEARLLSEPHPGPHVVVLAWSVPPAALRNLSFDTPTLSLLEARGVVFEDVPKVAEREARIPEWLTRRDGAALFERWSRDSHATAEFVTEFGRSGGAAHHDWQPGTGAWLAAGGQRTSVGRIVRATGVGPREGFRTPTSLVASAKAWLLSSPEKLAARPFALLLDFRSSVPRPVERLEPAIAALSDVLDLFGGLERCAVLLVLEAGRDRAAVLSGPTGALPGDPRAGPGRFVSAVHPAELAERLLGRSALDLSSE